MTEDRRQFFRITPHALNAELAGHCEVKMHDISQGGAKFEVPTDEIDNQLQAHQLLLELDKDTFFTLPFEVVGHSGAVFRVRFGDMNSSVEAALARYILNWQQRRAFLTPSNHKF